MTLLRKLFGDDDKSERCYRIVDVENSFSTKLIVEDHEYTLEIEGVMVAVAPERDIRELKDEPLKKIQITSPVKK